MFTHVPSKQLFASWRMPFLVDNMSQTVLELEALVAGLVTWFGRKVKEGRWCHFALQYYAFVV